MFNMGFTEMVLLAVIALVVIGPKQLPSVARTVAKFLNELKGVSDEVKKTFTDVQNDAMSGVNQFRDSMLKEERDLKKSLEASLNPTPKDDKKNQGES